MIVLVTNLDQKKTVEIKICNGTKIFQFHCWHMALASIVQSHCVGATHRTLSLLRIMRLVSAYRLHFTHCFIIMFRSLSSFHCLEASLRRLARLQSIKMLRFTRRPEEAPLVLGSA